MEIPTAVNDILNTVTIELHSVLSRDHRGSLFNFTKDSELLDEGDQIIHRVMPSGVSRQCSLQLLREKLLHHKWGDAVMILLGTVQLDWKYRHSVKEQNLEEIMWRVGMDSILHHPSGSNSSEVMSGYKRSLGSYCERVDQVQILLEYVFSLLVKKDFSTAKEELRLYQNIETNVVHKEIRVENIEWWTVVIEGYLGLIEYILWKMVMQNDTPLSDDEFPIADIPDSAPDHAEIGQRACRHFDKVVSQLGIWDIFICKYVEILLYYDNADDAKDVLKTYSDLHPDNPNAHKFLYKFLCSQQQLGIFEYDFVKDLKVTSLQRLFKVAPSEELVKDLHHLTFTEWLENPDLRAESHFEDGSDLTVSLEVLLTMLDYSCWRDDHKLWKALHDAISVMKNAVGTKQTNFFVKSLFIKSERIHWWPAYHFSRNSEMSLSPSEHLTETAESKKFIADILI